MFKSEGFVATQPPLVGGGRGAEDLGGSQGHWAQCEDFLEERPRTSFDEDTDSQYE